MDGNEGLPGKAAKISLAMLALLVGCAPEGRLGYGDGLSADGASDQQRTSIGLPEAGDDQSTQIGVPEIIGSGNCVDPSRCCPREELTCFGNPDGYVSCHCLRVWSCDDEQLKCTQPAPRPAGVASASDCTWSELEYACPLPEGVDPASAAGAVRWTCAAEEDPGRGRCVHTYPPNPENSPEGSSRWRCRLDESDQLVCERDCVEGESERCGERGPDGELLLAGSCRPGTRTCQDGTWGSCQGAVGPTAEICNGRDDDCDGDSDETCACTPGDQQPCGSTVGECRAGTQTCDANGNWGLCQGAVGPTAEVCNGRDDDCDGDSDETCACTPGDQQPCGSTVGECRAGTQTCDANGNWGLCQGAVGPTAEVCNGRDDDCDGNRDSPIGAEICDNGCGPGQMVCSDGRLTCQAPAKITAPDGSQVCAPTTPCVTDAECDATEAQACVPFGNGQRYCFPVGRFRACYMHVYVAQAVPESSYTTHVDRGTPAGNACIDGQPPRCQQSQTELRCDGIYHNTILGLEGSVNDLAALGVRFANPADLDVCLVGWGIHTATDSGSHWATAHVSSNADGISAQGLTLSHSAGVLPQSQIVRPVSAQPSLNYLWDVSVDRQARPMPYKTGYCDLHAQAGHPCDGNGNISFVSYDELLRAVYPIEVVGPGATSHSFVIGFKPARYGARQLAVIEARCRLKSGAEAAYFAAAYLRPI